MSDYAHPEAFASTEWLAEHLTDPQVRVIELGWDTATYTSGHVPGAGCWVYNGDLIQTTCRNIPGKADFEAMLARAGIANETTVVLYDSFSNLFSALAFWIMKIYGHQDVRLLDGDRSQWISEGRPLTTDIPVIPPTTYQAHKPNWTLRAHRDIVLEYIDKRDRVLVDARPIAMYNGDDAMGGSIGGHIPGAINVPAVMEMEDGEFRRWQTPTTNADRMFKSADDLRTLFSSKGVTPDREVIIYCVRAGLSSHMWFVLKYLLGYPQVRLYDGSWAEWGNLIGVPVERANS